MPKLWNDTIEEHRRAVREATITATAALVVEHGLSAVTMSGIAQRTGIGRATLYKYFPDVDSILSAWHERQITDHLTHLAQVRDHASSPGEQLSAVLEAYAQIAHRSHDTPLATQLHRGEHMVHGEQQLHRLIRDLLADAVEAGRIRLDVPVDELTHYCLHALTAADSLRSKAAIHRLVAVTMAGMTTTT